jgi:hypothetical protein
VALLVPELDVGAVAEEPDAVEPELFVEPEPFVVEPPEVAAVPDEELWVAELLPVLAVECVAPGSSYATTPPAATPASPIAAVTARSRYLARSRAATARATSCCRLVIARTSSLVVEQETACRCSGSAMS